MPKALKRFAGRLAVHVVGYIVVGAFAAKLHSFNQRQQYIKIFFFKFGVVGVNRFAQHFGYVIAALSVKICAVDVRVKRGGGSFNSSGFIVRTHIQAKWVQFGLN
jgi:hypothetical protein